MKVTIETHSEETLKDYDYRDILRISFNGKQVFEVSDGEPEDGNLNRDFCDCYNIANMLQEAYEAGRKGEKLIITETKI